MPNIIVFTPTSASSPWAKQYEWLIGIIAPYNPSLAIAILGKKNSNAHVDSWIDHPTGGAVLNANTLTQSINGMSIYTIKPSATKWLQDYEYVIGAPVDNKNVLAIFGSHRNHKFADWTKRKDHGATIAGNTLYGFVPTTQYAYAEGGQTTANAALKVTGVLLVTTAVTYGLYLGMHKFLKK